MHECSTVVVQHIQEYTIITVFTALNSNEFQKYIITRGLPDHGDIGLVIKCLTVSIVQVHLVSLFAW